MTEPVREIDLYEEIQAIAAQYPLRRSAVMPALRLAQEQHGWLPPEAFREVAEALDLTPAYCKAVASFYDMFQPRAGRQAPRRGLHERLVRARRCPADARGLRARARDPGRRDEPRRGRHPAHCSSARAAAAGGPSSRSTTATASRSDAEDVPAIVEELRGRLGRSSSRTPTRQTSRSSPSTSASAATSSFARRSRWSRRAIKEEVSRRGSAVAAGRRSRWAARRSSSRGPTRRRSRSTSWSTPTSRSRAPSRTGRSCCACPHLLLEGILISSFAIGARHAFIYIRGEYLDAYEVLRDALDEAQSRGLVGANVLGSGWSCPIVHPSRRGRLHLRRGDRAPRLARGQARQAAHEAAVPGHRGPVRVADARSTTSRRSASVPKIIEHGRRGATRRSASRTRPARASSRSRATSCEAATTRSSSAR